jgi:hypothetical protein
MIECTIRYYFESPQGRIVLLERAVHFPSVPFVGSQLSLKDDCLTVEHVHFCEDSPPILFVPNVLIESDAEINQSIEEKKEHGWRIESDILRKSA